MLPKREAQFRCLAGLAAVFLGRANPIVSTLRRAESDDRAMSDALNLLNRAPSLMRRKIISVFGAMQWAHQRPRQRA